MARIYTRSGDDGTTGLPGGRRVDKNDPILKTLGDLDELNAAIGWAAGAVTATRCAEALGAVQHRLLEIGAQLSGGDPEAGPTEADVGSLEQLIDELET
ncbi:MAG: ATP:cob(I)alamin adenosyltransferase, partial [Phycisphaeraceae bacterium]|nr:ATP:cob(I)alamin adenosyltransferase [Phycisphaeraceae bacterium]